MNTVIQAVIFAALVLALCIVVDMILPHPRRSKLVQYRHGNKRRVIYQEDGMPLAFWDEDE